MSDFLKIAERYDYFLCDLWGVIHDGDDLYPGVLEALEALSRMDKKLVFLSNAPRLAETVTVRMDAMGVKREWYAGAMTSGEAAVSWLSRQESVVSDQEARSGDCASREPAQQRSMKNSGEFFGNNKRYYYLGLERDGGLLSHIPQKRVESLAEADFFFNGNFAELGQPVEEVIPLLEEAVVRQLPMLCINPDIEVTKLSGLQILCAGYLADRYKELGGEVEYIGKPYPYVFELGMELLGNPAKDRVLMIGDNAMTDIKGGNDFGIDTAFVTQGILQNQKGAGQSPQAYCESKGVKPTYIIERL